ncbi:hypothetical protein N3K66_000181 [Trichothecium roseum]|uniref:Uncharacterized protein n=1 Tax=Trichothecium roseum TaxID=47278 RepID=A0ACC0VCP3_9HYPO|nr:hypothetical protein N3K66_000181 [Trichothecium roseum]
MVKHWSLAPSEDADVPGEVLNAKETGRAVNSLAVSLDVHILVAAQGNTVDIHDTSSGKDLEFMQRIQAQGDISHIALSRDGRLLAISTFCSGVEIYNIEDSSLVQGFDGHHGRITRAAFSPDGQRVASASDNCTFKVWPATESPADHNVLVRGHAGPVRLAVCGHLSGPVSDVAFFPAQPGHVLAACSNKSVARWDWRENKVAWRLSNCDYVWRGFRFDAAAAATAGDTSCYVMTDLGSRYVRELASTLTHHRAPD